MIVTLTVPARPEALSVIRVVVMSAAAIKGARLDEIYAKTHRVIDDFAQMLLCLPQPRHVLIRTPVTTNDVDLVAVP